MESVESIEQMIDKLQQSLTQRLSKYDDMLENIEKQKKYLDQIE